MAKLGRRWWGWGTMSEPDTVALGACREESRVTMLLFQSQTHKPRTARKLQIAG